MMTDKGQRRPPVVRIFGDGGTLQPQHSFCRCQQPGHDAEQAGFSAAIGPGQQQRLTGTDSKVEAGEDQTSATLAGKGMTGKAHDCEYRMDKVAWSA